MDELWYYLGGAFGCMAAWVVGCRLLSRKRGQSEHFSCAFCGYFTSGLPTSICPECGQDLTVVGVRSPSRRLEINPQTRLVLTLASFVLAFGVSTWLIWIAFHERLQPGTFFFSDQVVLAATDGRWTVQIDRAAYAYCWPWECDSKRAAITQSYAWSITIDRDGVSGPCSPDGILEGRLGDTYAAEERYRGLSFSELPADLRELLRETTKHRFWVDCRSDRYGWTDPESKDQFYRAGEYRPELDAWLEKWAGRLTQPALPARLQNAVNLALPAPFLGGRGLTYAGFRVCGSGRGYDWDGARRWTVCFWAGASVMFLVAALVIVRKSVWYKARRSTTVQL